MAEEKKTKNGQERTEENPNGAGRPQKPLDWEALKQLCRIHCTEAEIANVLNLNVETLALAIKREYGIGFKDFYQHYQDEGKASLRRQMWKAAEGAPPEVLRDAKGEIVRDGKGNPVIIPGQTPNVIIQIFKAKNELGYKDKQDIEFKDVTLRVVEDKPNV